MLNSDFHNHSDFNGMEVRSITVGSETAKRIKNQELVIVKVDGKQMFPLRDKNGETGEYVFFVGVKPSSE